MLLSLLRRITYCKYSHLKRQGLLLAKRTATEYSGRENFCTTSGGSETSRRRLVLGIETSCDDTGAAVVDDHGTVVGDALNSQTKTHVE